MTRRLLLLRAVAMAVMVVEKSWQRRGHDCKSAPLSRGKGGGQWGASCPRVLNEALRRDWGRPGLLIREGGRKAKAWP